MIKNYWFFKVGAYLGAKYGFLAMFYWTMSPAIIVLCVYGAALAWAQGRHYKKMRELY